MLSNNCPNCGYFLKENETVCPACGTKIQAQKVVSSPPEPNPQFPDSGRMISCPDCGREISARALTCPHCGAPIQGTQALVQMIRRDWGFEWRTQTEIAGWPLIHIAVGRKGGKLRVAKGIIAIGQFALGVFTIAQFGVGILFGFGQFMLAPVCIGQLAIALIFGLGQFTSGYIAIGQVAIGYYALAQFAIASYAWTPDRHDPEAVAFFTNLFHYLRLK